MDRKTVIIIGSGLGGLTTGVVLAKNGYRVTVLEQNPVPGGCLQCFTRRGVKFETGMHFVGSADEGQILNRMMRYLEIADRVELSRLDPRCYNVVCLGGQRFEFASGPEAFIERMADYFPSQRDNLSRYCRLVDRISAASSLHTLKYGQTDDALTAEYQLRSVNDVIESLTSDPLLRKVLVGDLPLYAAVRDKTPFSVHAFVRDFYGRSAFRFVGGSDSLVRALTDVMRRHGGEIRTRARVTRILCDTTHATGVELDSGERLVADYIISATHPMRTMEMLGDTHLIRPAYRRRIRAIPQTVGGFSVYLHFKPDTVPYMNHNFFGYETDTPWGCEQYDEHTWPKGYLYMHVCDQEGQAFARAGVILTYMRCEELAAWTGTTPGHRGAAYDDFVRRRAERLIQALDHQFPGIAGSIAHYYVSSPLTYRDYTGTQDGSLYGIARDISLGSAGRVTHRTRIPNLFLTGQNVNSHGMLGVIVGTMLTCGELLTPKYIYEQILEANK